MNDIVNSGALNVASLAISLFGALVAWFFINRASVRANQQVELLEALLEQEKRQTALLRRLCDANEPEAQTPAATPAATQDDDDGFVRLVAER
ncbi:YebO family protein [Cronobacter turicensis]|nr:YebO family protein [Cronobacter turicensis]ELY4381980.1 YebO family protein [Cronobacter turicensis]ELY6269036.1 YebO family protein [Cronobacter turicensis]